MSPDFHLASESRSVFLFPPSLVAYHATPFADSNFVLSLPPRPFNSLPPRLHVVDSSRNPTDRARPSKLLQPIELSSHILQTTAPSALRGSMLPTVDPIDQPPMDVESLLDWRRELVPLRWFRTKGQLVPCFPLFLSLIPTSRFQWDGVRRSGRRSSSSIPRWRLDRGWSVRCEWFLFSPINLMKRPELILRLFSDSLSCFGCGYSSCCALRRVIYQNSKQTESKRKTRRDDLAKPLLRLKSVHHT